ncbi:sigma-54 dependent transcriptional regulator [Fulvivirgaceae bacterium BMA12]|uniref:Sigma-54 dependent transcriptional regulator n=1 Tax=Agaribacillus aureus TaxID=3051825 RepID=A0ABT8L1Y1_9BACT|nr:sigma-54 dependent transcriptional regulator [Fulvivirgaceae bacterium BMA12]
MEQLVTATQRSLIKIFIVEDDVMFGDLVKMKLDENPQVDAVLFKSGEEMFREIHQQPDIVILDYFLPYKNGVQIIEELQNLGLDIAVILLSGQKNVEVVVEAYKLGAKNYIIKNENALVELDNCVRNLGDNINLKKEIDVLKDQIIDRNSYSGIIGESQAIQRVFALMQKIKNSDVLALITGESGTGKEVVAKTLHYNSPRRRKSFVAINVAAIPDDLIESELFGYEKGAFTGASGRRLGKFEQANGGTIFLDEIGEIDLNVQKKLLRVLQEKKISRLGSNKEIDLNVRVIAATNKSLGQLVKENKFREDLYYRLQGFLIHLPPLRERGNDVIILAKYFLSEFCALNKMEKKSFSSNTLMDLMKYRWPGNIRELKSVIERACLISEGEKITLDDLIYSEAIN